MPFDPERVLALGATCPPRAVPVRGAAERGRGDRRAARTPRPAVGIGETPVPARARAPRLPRRVERVGGCPTRSLTPLAFQAFLFGADSARVPRRLAVAARAGPSEGPPKPSRHVIGTPSQPEAAPPVRDRRGHSLARPLALGDAGARSRHSRSWLSASSRARCWAPVRRSPGGHGLIGGSSGSLLIAPDRRPDGARRPGRSGATIGRAWRMLVELARTWPRASTASRAGTMFVALARRPRAAALAERLHRAGREAHAARPCSTRPGSAPDLFSSARGRGPAGARRRPRTSGSPIAVMVPGRPRPARSRASSAGTRTGLRRPLRHARRPPDRPRPPGRRRATGDRGRPALGQAGGGAGNGSGGEPGQVVPEPGVGLGDAARVEDRHPVGLEAGEGERHGHAVVVVGGDPGRGDRCRAGR